MKNTLETLGRFRNYLTENCKNMNTGKSPIFVFISLIGGIALAVVSVFFAPVLEINVCSHSCSVGFANSVASFSNFPL